MDQWEVGYPLSGEPSDMRGVDFVENRHNRRASVRDALEDLVRFALQGDVEQPGLGLVRMGIACEVDARL